MRAVGGPGRAAEHVDAASACGVQGIALTSHMTPLLPRAGNCGHLHFSILQRKAISPTDFADLDDLAVRILAFQDRYNTSAELFDWTYTRDDLNTFLKRLAQHDLRAELREAA
jgi:hypothetical protein